MSGLALACVVPNKGHPVYAEGELRRFILETGRTFGVLQADPEASLVALAETVTSELGGLSLRKSPTEWKQAQGAVGNSQQLLYAQVRTLRQDLADRYGTLVPITSSVFTWLVKHAQFLLNNFAIRSDGLTPFERRWSKRYASALRKSICRLPVSEQVDKQLLKEFQAKPWDPKGRGKDTDVLVLPPAPEIQGLPPLPVQQTDGTSAVDLSQHGLKRTSDELGDEAQEVEPPNLFQRVGPAQSDLKRSAPDSVPGSETKLQRISAVFEDDSLPVACACVASISTKSGLDVPIEPNLDREEELQALRAAEPVIWYDAEFDREQEIAGMNKEMTSIKDFDVYEEKLITECTSEQLENAISTKWVKRAKGDGVKCRVCVRGYTTRKYLAGTKPMVLTLRPKIIPHSKQTTFDIDTYVDSDWAGCATSRRSTSGMALYFLGTLITSQSRTQATVALSSGEAELYAIGLGVSESLFIRWKSEDFKEKLQSSKPKILNKDLTLEELRLLYETQNCEELLLATSDSIGDLV
eukprot:symbB.v1.2.037353.t1/scaffold5493.1/size26513/3